MTASGSAIFEGTVVHKRLSPKPHAFAYRVFTLCLDLDEIASLDRELRLFSVNRRNVVSFWDSDLGPGGPEAAAEKARALLDHCGLGVYGARIELVCYPRLLGYVFNPLSVYFCRNSDGRLGAVVYEVSNTFSERKSYVIPIEGESGIISQQCVKDMYVSPFTKAAGSYGFHCVAPSERVVIGVNFREAGRPVLKTHFAGVRRPLSDRALLSAVTRHPLMTMKVMAAIHFEAARLWAKGVPVVTRHASPAYSYTRVNSSRGTPAHV
ncbi:MAG TPA: DUF1365 domain-containing protein [Hyphomicrobiaceae bacterium]|nr:DUF1365 domain-containing protein [Hyphomicrobiaceae bacterium]